MTCGLWNGVVITDRLGTVRGVNFTFSLHKNSAGKKKHMSDARKHLPLKALLCREVNATANGGVKISEQNSSHKLNYSTACICTINARQTHLLLN